MDVRFITSSPDLKGRPEPVLPEFAFIGRSNCGKSFAQKGNCDRHVEMEICRNRQRRREKKEAEKKAEAAARLAAKRGNSRLRRAKKSRKSQKV